MLKVSLRYAGLGPIFKLLKQIQIMLVEAAGVEPASEKARREKNYVRFRFGNCRPPH
jgi:hypothetical protein